MDKFSIVGSDGSVSVSASVSAYTKALTEWKLKNEMPTEEIESAVEAVFDRFNGYRLSMPALLHEAVAVLQGTPLQHKALTDRVRAYVTAQCGVGDARNTGRLDIQKGSGGGVKRLAKPGQEIPVRISKSDA